MTGTGIVPPDDFTLARGDKIRITIDPIGTLENDVVQGRTRPDALDRETRKDCSEETIGRSGIFSTGDPAGMPRLPRRRWRIAWLLGIGVLVNYFDRVNLSVSHDALIAAFGISDVVFGYLSSAYNWTYAAVPVAHRRGSGQVRRAARGAHRHVSVERGIVCRRRHAQLSADSSARASCSAWAKRRRFPPTPRPSACGFRSSERSLATSLFDAAAKFASAIGVPLIGIVLSRPAGAGASRSPAPSALLTFFTSGASIAIPTKIRN